MDFPKGNREMPLRVVCAIIENNGKILVAQRSNVMKMPLKWEFPGGKLESDETEIAGLKREIREELELEIEPMKRLRPCIYQYPNFLIELIPYVSNLVSGTLQVTEHKQILWLPKSDLSNLDWAEADAQIVKGYLGV